MDDRERLAAFRAHGHDVHLLSDGRFVLKLNGRWFRVAGGDFVSPSLIGLPAAPLELFDESKDPPPSPGGFRGLKG